MVGVAARPLNADHAGRRAIVIETFVAARAITAARPRINKALCADRRRQCIGSRRDDSAERLVAERYRRMHAAIAHVQALAAAENEIAVANMGVAVAHAAVLEFDEHLRARWRGGLPLDFFKRLAPLDNVVTQHRSAVNLP